MSFILENLTQFTTLSYLIFLSGTAVLYYLTKKHYLILLLASILFYGTFSLTYCLLFILLLFINFLFGLILSTRRKKAIIILAVFINLLVLIFFRYSNFLLQNTLGLISQMPAWQTNIIIPLGISFFTFEVLHYLIDIYKGAKPIKNPALFALFILFFPSQVAGPIKRFQDFIPQIKIPLAFSSKHISDGVLLIGKGFFQKIVLANTLSEIVEGGFDDPTKVTLITLYAFALQIYFDFAGYTNIGIGSAKVLGIELPENFNAPYRASSPADFWRRWHMSLMRWFREYIYLPLGGNKNHPLRNTLLVFIISGIWHGAAWHFVFWGLYNGLLVLGTRFVEKVSVNKKIPGFLYKRWVVQFVTFHLICFGWVLFRASDIHTAIQIYKYLIKNIFLVFTLTPEIMLVSIVLICTILSQKIISIMNETSSTRAVLQGAYYAAAVILIVIFSTSAEKQFIYFQF